MHGRPARSKPRPSPRRRGSPAVPATRRQDGLPALPTLVQHLLERAAAVYPDRVALVAAGARLTYARLDDQANRLAGALAAAGVGRGDRVVLSLDNSAEAVIGIFAALKAGATFVILNPSVKRDKLERILNDCRPTALIVDAPRLETVRGIDRLVPSLRYLLAVGEALPPAATDHARAEPWAAALARAAPPPRVRPIDLDLACIIYTSGSTGVPKGVMSTHRNVLAATTAINQYLENGTDDVIFDALPLSFDYGLYQIFLAFQAGARVVLERRFLYPAEVVQRLRAERVTGLPGVPTIFALLIEHRREPYDLPALRYLTNTAAALPVHHIERLRRLFPGARLFSMYGLTECKRVSYLPPQELDRRPTSVGIPIPNSEVWVVDEHGRRLPPGAVGELVVRGSHVMRGYWGDPAETAKRFRPGPLPGETVLYTGDLVRMDEEGYLYFIGRMDDMIKSRGEKISPAEIEAVARALPGVREAAAFGVPDPVLGEAVTLVVTPLAGGALTTAQVRAHCRRHLEDFMVPRRIEIWPDLPHTPTGKIDKPAIRARLDGLPGAEDIRTL
jgi:long-chain acyl-CoA synthetase